MADSSQSASANRAAILILGFLALLLAARGLYAMYTGSYLATARLSGPYELTGLEARLTGAGYVFLGLMVASSLGFQLNWNKKKTVLAACATCFAAILCFGMGMAKAYL